MTFDYTITLGNVLTVLSILGGLIGAWFRVQMRLKAVEQDSRTHKEWIAAHQECNLRQIEILNEMREGLAFIKGQLKGISGRSTQGQA